MPAREGGAPYGAMDGTSMASPAAVGILAAVLGEDKVYQGLPRSTVRAARARATLRSIYRDVGFDRRLQGAGVPAFRSPH